MIRDDIKAALVAAMKGGDKPALDDAFEALVLLPSGIVLAYDHRCRAIEEELPTATGSGRELAIGAMIDFGPLFKNPFLLLFGAAAQFGIFFTLIVENLPARPSSKA